MPSPRSAHPQDGLTPRQREILDFIRNRLSESGAPPTRLEIYMRSGAVSPFHNETGRQ
jgi:SOS-response transcriptional repressor LexA